ncbi:MAG: hypothetical protein ACJ8F7_23420 [Gemmataceae bacterium]
MADFERMARDLISADGKIDDTEVRVLRKHLYEDGKITHSELTFLMELKKRAKRKSQSFDRFYLKAAGDSILDNRLVSHEEIGIIKKIIADKKLPAAEVKRFLNHIKKEAKPNVAFDKLHAAYMAKHK